MSFLEEWLARQAPERIQEVGGRLIVVLHPDAVLEMLQDAAEQLSYVRRSVVFFLEKRAVGGELEIVDDLLPIAGLEEMLDEQDSSLGGVRRFERLPARSAVLDFEASEVPLTLCMN